MRDAHRRRMRRSMSPGAAVDPGARRGPPRPRVRVPQTAGSTDRIEAIDSAASDIGRPTAAIRPAAA